MAMTVPILQTKLYVPPPRADAISRPRLLRRLDEGLRLRRTLTLVAAAAGFGKTTLVSEWIAEKKRPVAWLSVDATDNDPARFLSHGIAALQTIDAAIGIELMALLDAAQPPAVDVIVPSLINEIVERLPPFTLVLDDYHLIEERAIHQALTLLIEHMPATMHLVLITRVDPPLPLARLRVRDQMTEVRAADLRFSREEAARFLNERMGLDLTPDDVAALEARTEGWVAGLQLAALSLQGEADVAHFIDSFAGSDRYVLDYLMEEVLARQSQDVQTFLLRTSILERLSGSLCDAVTGRADGQQMLAALESKNLFLIPLDNRRIWYRYHQIFADLLRFRLQAALSQEVESLHLRASAWYAQNDFVTEAIAHALAAQAWNRAADLIEQAVPLLGKREGSILFLLEFCEQLPEAVLAARPAVSLYYAWLLADTAQHAAAERRLQQLEAGAGATLDHFAGIAAAIRSQLAVSQGQPAEAVTHARQALAQMSADEQSLWRDLAALSLLFGAYQMGNLQQAEDALAQLPPLDQHPSAVQLLTYSLGGFVLLARGEYHAAADHFHHILQHAVLDDKGSRLHPMAGLAQIGLGQIYLSWNRVDEAAPLIESGLRLGVKTQNVITLVQGYQVLLNLRWAQDDEQGFEEALERVRTLEQDLRGSGVWLTDAVAVYRRRIEAMAGRLDGLHAWLARQRAQQRTKSDPEGGEPVYGTQLQELALARVLLAVGQASAQHHLLEEASALLRRLASISERQHLHNVQIQAWLDLALVRQALGQDDAALVALERAIALAAPAGIVRHFLDEGEPMRHLLRSLSQHPRAPTYAATLLDAFGERSAPETPQPSSGASPDPQQANQDLVEPLTDRELDVLQLMAQGCTNREIAEQLTVTVGTVKSHAKRIYGKLAVGNRTEAAARARELGLI